MICIDIVKYCMHFTVSCKDVDELLEEFTSNTWALICNLESFFSTFKLISVFMSLNPFQCLVQFKQESIF